MEQQSHERELYTYECNRCGYTRLLHFLDGIDPAPCRAPHPHSTYANPVECGGTSFDMRPAGAACGVRRREGESA